MNSKSKISQVIHFSKNLITTFVNYHMFKIILPLGSVIYLGYLGYKYNRIFFIKNGLLYNKLEENIISKKLTTLMKFKNIENLYDKNSKEVKILTSLYSSLIKELKLKQIRPDVYLFKSDDYICQIVPNGSLFISDQMYYSIKEIGKDYNFELLIFLILHSLNHIINNDTNKNITNIFSRVDLLNQIDLLKNQETGVEHYYLHYYLYLPFTQKQEIACLNKALSQLRQINKDIDLSIILNSYSNLQKQMNDFYSYDINTLKNDLSSNTTNQYKKYIIYGDIFDSKLVDVNLHQRTAQKIKYNKNTYNTIHKYNKNIENQLLKIQYNDYSYERNKEIDNLRLRYKQ